MRPFSSRSIFSLRTRWVTRGLFWFSFFFDTQMYTSTKKNVWINIRKVFVKVQPVLRYFYVLNGRPVDYISTPWNESNAWNSRNEWHEEANKVGPCFTTFSNLEIMSERTHTGLKFTRSVCRYLICVLPILIRWFVYNLFHLNLTLLDTLNYVLETCRTWVSLSCLKFVMHCVGGLFLRFPSHTLKFFFSGFDSSSFQNFFAQLV